MNNKKIEYSYYLLFGQNYYYVSMRKFLLSIISICLTISPCLAEGGLESVDMTDYSSTTQNLKYFSEKDYQKAINQYKNKGQHPKKQRAKDKKVTTSVDIETDGVNQNPEFSALQDIVNHKGTIMIPTYCTTDAGEEIAPGHYTMEYVVDATGTDWLVLSQGSRQVAKIAPEPSDAAEDETTINYAYAVGKNNRITLLYGNMDIAVEATLYVEE